MQGEKDGGKEDSREERSEKGKSGEKIHPLLCTEGFMMAITHNFMLLMERILEYAIRNGAKTGLVLLAYTKKKDKIVAKWVSS